jgi:hypothetical protein
MPDENNRLETKESEVFKKVLWKYHDYQENGAGVREGLTRFFKDLEVFKKVLWKYYDYQENGAGVRGGLTRFFKDYSYQGDEAQTHTNIIKLIDRIALIDTSGEWIDLLIIQFNRMSISKFDEKNKEYFLNRFYKIFEGYQNAYFERRRKEEKKFKERLIKHYNLEQHKKWFDKSYDAIVHHKEEEIKDSQNIPLFGKLIYDLKQIKAHFEEEDEAFQEQAKKLKKDIHHVMEEYSFPSKIKKRKPTIEDPSIYYVNYKAKFQPIPEEKAEKRKIQKLSKKIALTEAVTSSVGEAFVAVSGALVISPALAFLVLVFLSGWYINRLLFKNDSEDVFNAFFIKKEITNAEGKKEKHRLMFLVKNAEGNYEPIPTWKKNLIYTLGIFSIVTGFVYGCLNCVSTLTFVHSSQLLLGALCTVSASIPAIGVALAISWIFFKVMADFIKNDRLTKIGQYLYKNFYDVPWREMSGPEIGKHVFKCFCKTVLFLAAVAITTIVTIASFAVFYKSCLGIFDKIAKANANPFARAATWINNLISFPFQINSTNRVTQSLFFKERHSFSGLFADSHSDNKPQRNALQKEVAQLHKIEKAVALGANVLNGIGQSGVNKTSETPLSTNATVNIVLSTVCTPPYSCLPNKAAGDETIAQKEVAPVNIEPVEVNDNKAVVLPFYRRGLSKEQATTRNDLLRHQYRSR